MQKEQSSFPILCATEGYFVVTNSFKLLNIWNHKWLCYAGKTFSQCHPAGQRSLVGYSPKACKESDATEVAQHAHTISLSAWSLRRRWLGSGLSLSSDNFQSINRQPYQITNIHKKSIKLVAEPYQSQKLKNFGKVFSDHSLIEYSDLWYKNQVSES